jgi:hypothetical protein
MYFPSLRHHFEQLLKTRDELARLHGEFSQYYRREGPARDYREERKAFISVITRLDKDEEDIKQSICTLADQLRG